MFWESLQSAFDVLAHVETWLVVVVYLFIMLAPIILIFYILQHNHAISIRYFRRLYLPVIEAMIIAVIVLTLFPLIFGMSEEANWEFPFRAMKLSPAGFIGLIVILVLLAYIIDVVPRLRKLQSFKTLLMGGVCLVFARIFLSFINPVIDTDVASFIPGFWFICGLVGVSIILSKLGHFIFQVFAIVLGNKFNLKEEVAELLILPIVATLGFLPLFIYGAWLG